TGDTSDSMDVSFEVGGTATADVDYTALPDTVTIPAGPANIKRTANTFDDPFVEGNETVDVTLDPDAEYILGTPDSATVTIADDTSGHQSVVTVAATDPSASEQGPDPGVFTVSRSGDTSAALTVSYTLGGAATNGVDYTTLSGTVTIPAGQA